MAVAANRGGSQQTLQQQQQIAQSVSLYPHLQSVVRQVLEVVLESDSEDSAHEFTMFVLQFRWQENGQGGKITDIGHYFPPHQSDAVLKGRVLEVLAHWIGAKATDLDYFVQMSHSGYPLLAERCQACRRQLEQACYQSHPSEVLAEFVYSTVIDLIGRDAACLGSVLGGLHVQHIQRADLLSWADCPSVFLASLVQRLEELQAKISKVVMELYLDTGFMSYDDCKNLLMMFFQYYTVETTTGTLELHDSTVEQTFVDSSFRVSLVDSFGSLMKLLRHWEFQFANLTNGHELALAVDFEGVKLCRHGPLCLIQLTISDDPTLVYVLDVHVLGKKCFAMQTPNGTSMKSLLEDPNIRKVWFDPRNDVDALWHQFGVMPQGIFDLQLAEVADRRNRGLNVHFVQGLTKCLTQCVALDPEQKMFAERINSLGKSIFEPQNGGSYKIFQQRPLNPVILVYAAHDSRYMLALYDQYVQAIGPSWVRRVLRGGEQRGRWCLNREWVNPPTEAPDF